MRSQPDAATLMRLAVDYLDTSIYPTLSGPERYRARVALNALRIVEREIALGPALERAESDELQAMRLDGHANPPSLETLVQEIESGKVSLDNRELRTFLRNNLRRALSVNNPRWLEEP